MTQTVFVLKCSFSERDKRIGTEFPKFWLPVQRRDLVLTASSRKMSTKA